MFRFPPPIFTSDFHNLLPLSNRHPAFTSYQKTNPTAPSYFLPHLHFRFTLLAEVIVERQRKRSGKCWRKLVEVLMEVLAEVRGFSN